MNRQTDLTTPSWPGLSRPSASCLRAAKEDVDARHRAGHDGWKGPAVTLASACAALLLVTPAFAHVGHGETSSFAAGFAHPLGGLDHVAVMIAVGLWAALKGGRALWLWPAAFVSVMLVGGALGMSHVALPFVEPAILASVVALGLLVALAVDVPVAAGAAIVGAFALFHGHAHGTEVADGMSGVAYMAGFALATAALHLVGIGLASVTTRLALAPAIRVAGFACVAVGIGLFAGVL
jgi:urease accessory protein